MTQEIIKKYNQEKERISKIADTFQGALNLLNLYKDIYKESADHINTAIEQFAKLATFGKAVI